MLRRFGIDRKRSLGLRLGKIDIGKRRGVDQHIEFQLIDIVMISPTFARSSWE